MTCVTRSSGRSCQNLGFLVPITGDPGLHIISEKLSYTGNVLMVTTARSESTLFNVISGIVHNTYLFGVTGNELVRFRTPGLGG